MPAAAIAQSFHDLNHFYSFLHLEHVYFARPLTASWPMSIRTISSHFQRPRLGVIPTCDKSPQLREGKRRELPERRELTLRTDLVAFMGGNSKPP